MITIILLIFSNIFMTFAWYGHLKYQNVPLWKVTLISWGIALFEYSFQVPANRIGSHTFNAAQLKTIQEIITLVVFSGFSVWYLKQDIKWNYAVGFFFMVVAAFFIFRKWKRRLAPIGHGRLHRRFRWKQHATSLRLNFDGAYVVQLYTGVFVFRSGL